MGRLVHTGSSSLVAHVLQYPPTHANSFVLGPAVINTHMDRTLGGVGPDSGSSGGGVKIGTGAARTILLFHDDDDDDDDDAF